MRATNLRQNCGWLPEPVFRRRRAYFIDARDGVFCQEVKSQQNPMQMLQDPSMMMQQQKNLKTLHPCLVFH